MSRPLSRPLLPRLRESKFRGNSSFKPSPCSTGTKSVFHVIAKGPQFQPAQLIAALTSLSQSSSPSLAALSVLAVRAASSSELFYPPQVIETLSLFGRISFSNDSLVNFFVARKRDLLNEPSPRRIVGLCSSFQQLQLPLLAVWPEIRAELVRLLPQLRRGVPAVLDALASQECVDEDLVEGLLTQAFLLMDEVDRNLAVHSLEAAAKLGIGKERLVEILKKNSIPKFSLNQSVSLLAASRRLGVEEGEEFVPRILAAFSSPIPIYDKARLLARIARTGLSMRLEPISEFIESGLSDKDYCRKFLPHNILSLALLGADPSLVQLLISRVRADLFSGQKLLCLLRASRMAGGTQTPQTASLIDLVKPLARQLSLRESRLLWECAPGVVPVHALPALRKSWDEDPYTLSAPEQLFLPSHLIFRPGTREIRPEILLRQSALGVQISSLV